MQVQKQWNGPRVVFNYLGCPECKQPVSCKSHPELHAIFEKELNFEKKIIKMALERAKHEDLHKADRLKNPKDPFYNDL
jgi:hypothetical protein